MLKACNCISKVATYFLLWISGDNIFSELNEFHGCKTQLTVDSYVAILESIQANIANKT